MKNSKTPLIVSLFNDASLGLPQVASAESADRSGGLSTVTVRAKGANFLTVGSQYKDQLQDLMETLQATNPHFVRCIIPNLEKKPGKLIPHLVLEQLRCNGVLEGIRISRKGFPNRVIYSDFIKRYYILSPNIPRNSPDAKVATDQLVIELKVDKEKYRMGLTKIFFRTGQLAYIEELRERKIAQMIIVVQAAARGWLGRRIFFKFKTQGQAARIIQKNLRGWLEIRNSWWFEMMRAAKPHLSKRKAIGEQLAELDKQIEEEKKKREQEKANKGKVEADVAAVKKKLEDVQRALKSERDASTEITDNKKKIRKIKN